MSKKRPVKSTNGAPPPANGRPEPKGCYVMSLTLENVRCFGPKQTLKFTDSEGRLSQWTIILGENGTGKTTLLRSLAGCDESWQQVGSIPGGRSRWAKILLENESEYHRRGQESGHGYCKLEYAHRPRLRGEGSLSPRQDFIWHVSQNLGIGYEGDGIRNVFAYGAGRRVDSMAPETSSRDDPLGTLFRDDALVRPAEDWLLRLDYTAEKHRNDQRQQARRDMVRQLLVAILPGVTSIRFDAGSGPFPRPKVEFQTPYGWVPLRQLGYGYQALIAWMLDFVSRMVERYPDSPDPLEEPAIVVVDEIDLHLHPKWQRQLIGFLSERFPNTQFIATAHSPLVVQAAEEANIAVLRRNDGDDFVTIVNDVDAIRGWRVDQILTSDLFGLASARDPATERLILRQQELTEKRKRTTKDEQELAEITAKLNGAPVGETADDVADMAALRRAIHALNKPPG